MPNNPSTANESSSKVMPWLFPLLVVGAAAVYFIFDPTIPTQWFPKCPFHLLTGLQCPGCGVQRAFHCFLHGNIMDGLAYNYFLIVLIPILLLVVLSEWYNQKHWFDWAYKFTHNNWTVISLVILCLLWWIVRNILKI